MLWLRLVVCLCSHFSMFHFKFVLYLFLFVGPCALPIHPTTNWWRMREHKSFIAFDRRPSPLVLERIMKSLIIPPSQCGSNNLNLWPSSDTNWMLENVLKHKSCLDPLIKCEWINKQTTLSHVQYNMNVQIVCKTPWMFRPLNYKLLIQAYYQTKYVRNMNISLTQDW